MWGWEGRRVREEREGGERGGRERGESERPGRKMWGGKGVLEEVRRRGGRKMEGEG